MNKYNNTNIIWEEEEEEMVDSAADVIDLYVRDGDKICAREDDDEEDEDKIPNGNGGGGGETPMEVSFENPDDGGSKAGGEYAIPPSPPPRRQPRRQLRKGNRGAENTIFLLTVYEKRQKCIQFKSVTLSNQDRNFKEIVGSSNPLFGDSDLNKSDDECLTRNSIVKGILDLIVVDNNNGDDVVKLVVWKDICPLYGRIFTGPRIPCMYGDHRGEKGIVQCSREAKFIFDQDDADAAPEQQQQQRRQLFVCCLHAKLHSLGCNNNRSLQIGLYNINYVSIKAEYIAKDLLRVIGGRKCRVDSRRLKECAVLGIKMFSMKEVHFCLCEFNNPRKVKYNKSRLRHRACKLSEQDCRRNALAEYENNVRLQCIHNHLYV